jgi:hypothetical protein
MKRISFCMSSWVLRTVVHSAPKPKVREYDEIVSEAKANDKELITRCKKYDCLVTPVSQEEALNLFAEGKWLIASETHQLQHLNKRKCKEMSKKLMKCNYRAIERWHDYVEEVQTKDIETIFGLQFFLNLCK